MKLLVNALKAAAIHMGIDLGGGDVGVAEEFLHRPQVGSADQKVGRETVAERVRVNVGEFGGHRSAFDDLPDGHAFKRLAVAREEEAAHVLGAGSGEASAALIEVGRDGGLRKLVDRDEALLIALARHADHPDGGVIFGEPKTGDLRSPKSAGVQEFEEGAVAMGEPRLLRITGVFGHPGAFQQVPHLAG